MGGGKRQHSKHCDGQEWDACPDADQPFVGGVSDGVLSWYPTQSREWGINRRRG